MLACAAVALAQSYLWPLAIDPILTSNFGEYRTGHPHAGLDLGTRQQIGTVAAVAADDGYVSRLKTAPNGYGKVVYVTLSDGRTAVYAHLDRFAGPVASYVRKRQDETGRYSISDFLEPRTLPVKRGDVIGYAGNTGTDAPHLHFEIRGGDNCPLNPLTNGFPVDDSRPPVAGRVRLVPLDVGSTVSGWHRARTFRLKRTSSGRYTIAETPSVWGRIGVEIEATDKSDTSERILAPYALTLRADGRPEFELRHDKFCYEDKRIIDHQYDFRMKLDQVGAFFRLFDGFGEDVDFHVSTAGNGRIELTDEKTHRLSVDLADAAGNRSEVAFEVLANRPPSIDSAIWEQRGTTNFIQVVATDPDGESPTVTARVLGRGDSLLEATDLEAMANNYYEATVLHVTSNGRILEVTATDRNGLRDRVRYWIGIDAPENPTLHWTIDERDGFLAVEIEPQFALKRPPIVSAYFEEGAPDAGPIVESPLRAFGTTTYRGVIPLPTDRNVRVRLRAGVRRNDQRLWLDERVVALQLVDSGRTVTSADGLAQASFASGSVYRPFHVRVTGEPARSFKGLAPIGDAYRFTRDAVPFRVDPTVRVRLPRGQDPSRVGLYLVDENRAWYLGDRRAGAAGFEAIPAHLGTFALYRDESAPWVTNLAPAAGQTVGGSDFSVTFSVGDVGSGLSESGIRVTLDGGPLIPEWHAVMGTVKTLPIPVVTGRHEVRVEVIDRAGNAVYRSTEFDVR